MKHHFSIYFSQKAFIDLLGFNQIICLHGVMEIWSAKIAEGNIFFGIADANIRRRHKLNLYFRCYEIQTILYC